MGLINYKSIFQNIINHKRGRFFLLDYGADQLGISIFAYNEVLKKLGINRIPRINNFVLLTALAEKEFLEKYKIGIRWLYAKPSKESRKLLEKYDKVCNINAEEEIKRGYVSGGIGNYFIDEWGVKWKRSAYYFEMVEHPLEGKSFEDIKKYKFPDPTDELRVENLYEELVQYYAENPNYVVSLCQSYGGLLETALWLRGFQDFFIDIGTNSKECNYLLDALKEYFIEWNRKYLSAVKGNVDVVAIGDDYGMQESMLLSPEIWRKQIKSRYKELISDIKSKYKNINWLHHSCGAIFPIIEDLIEIGVDILNSIQPKAKGMEPIKLKEEFGKRITFSGGIDIQELLPFGTPEGIRKEVLRILDILSVDGGFIIGPSHNIQARTPAENIIAFYDAVNEYAGNNKIFDK